MTKNVGISLSLLMMANVLYAQIELNEKDSFANTLITLGNISSAAALNVIGGFGSGPNTQATEHKMVCRIFHEKLSIGLFFDTSNSFDDDMEISLGGDFITANQSLQQIIDWYDNSPEGMSVLFKDLEGRLIQIDKNLDNIRLKVLKEEEFKVIVDNVYLSRQRLTNAQRLLNKKNAKKIYDCLLRLGMKQHPFVLSFENGTIFSRVVLDFLGTIDEIKDEEHKIKKEISNAKKANDHIMVEDLNKKIIRLQQKQNLLILSQQDLQYYPSIEREKLVSSVLDLLTAELNASACDTLIVNACFSALDSYREEYELPVKYDSDLQTLRESYKSSN